MAAERFTRVQTCLAKAQTFLRDPAGVRYEPEIMIDGIREAIDDLAQGGAFRRWDLFVPTSEQATFSLHAEAAEMISAQWDGTPLDLYDADGVQQRFGQRWREKTGPTPTACVGEAGRLRLVPYPEAAGTALTFANPTTRTEQEFRGVASADMWATLDGSDYVLFEPGDGQVTDVNPPAGNLLVEYAFFPLEADLEAKLPLRFERALKWYAIATGLGGSTRATPRQVSVSSAMQVYLREKRKLIERGGGFLGEDFRVSLTAELA